ncbi:hypothetical protein ACFL6I_01020 [candidate division KSB1 bacterium]
MKIVQNIKVINLVNRFVFKIALPVAVLLHVSQVFGQPLTWRTITSQAGIRDLVYHSGTFWAATGGGIFNYDISADAFTLYTNTEGLSSNHPSSLTIDTNGYLWIGMDDGTLNVFNLENGSLRRISIDPEPVTVNDLALDGDTLFIALDFGISLFLIDKEEVNSTFRVLGDFPVNTSVMGLYIHDGRLWAVTGRGIASADIDAPNLQDPQFWTNYTTDEGVPAGPLSGFAAIGDTLFAGTAEGVVRFQNDSFVSDGTFADQVNDLGVVSGILYAAGASAVYRRIRPGEWESVTPLLPNVTAVSFDQEQRVWTGSEQQGLFMLDSGQGEWVNHVPPGPGGNNFEEMIVDRHNRLWAATGQRTNSGIYLLDETGWRHFTTADGLTSSNTIGIGEGPDGKIWFGTPGSGAMVIELIPSGLAVAAIDTTDGRLIGAVTPGFVVVSQIKRDSRNVMWIANKFAENGNGLAAVTPQNEWHYFSLSDGLAGTDINGLELDGFDRVWISTEEHGISMLDHAGTLTDKSDDSWEHYTENRGLSSDRIRAIAAQAGNGVWVATEDGINHIIEDVFIENISGALSTFVSDVAVDPAHNIWFGTPNGISVLLADNLTWNHYTAENSGLVDNAIVSFFFDGPTGTMYVGTSSGLSVVTTPYRELPGGMPRISVFPNPFFIDGSSRHLTIEDIRLQSNVRIFTITGRLVRVLTPNDGVYGTQAFWDGLDLNGDPVPTGIYLISAGTDSNHSETQKVAVIRR